jgi:hypothetical protein
MSSVLSSAAANPTGGCNTQSYSTFPTEDIACAVAYASTDGLPSNYTDLMKGCCKDAPVNSYADNCALYCLSIGQSVADLQTCFQEAGINPGWIFCNGNNTATATATSGDSESTGGPSATGSKTGSTGGADSTGAASAIMAPQQGVSKAGLGMLAVLVVSVFAGALI